MYTDVLVGKSDGAVCSINRDSECVAETYWWYVMYENDQGYIHS
jgi:hypothetical protein